MNTGLTRQIDDLGRINIPREIRKRLGIHTGDSIELSVEGRKLIIEKYFPIGQYAEQAREYIRSFHNVTQRHVVVTDTEKIIASTIHNFIGNLLSDELMEAIRSMKNTENIPLQAGKNSAVAEHAAIIKDGGRDSHGAGIGAVVLVEDVSAAFTGTKAQMFIAADFLGRLANAEGRDAV